MVTTEYSILKTREIIALAFSKRAVTTSLEFELAQRLELAADLITDLEVALGCNAGSKG